MKTVTNRLVPGVIAFVAALGLLLLSVPAMALPSLNFKVTHTIVGKISFAGGTSPLVGENIPVATVQGFDNSQNSGVLLDCISCLLSFQTGGFTGFITNPVTLWSFGNGGSITLIGGVDLNDDGILDTLDGDIGLGTTLVTGVFAGTTTVLDQSNQLKIAGAAFIDTKDSDLAAFYGLPGGSTLYDGNFNFFFTTPQNNFSFESNVILDGTITNQPYNGTPAPVPEPATLLLLGSGLVGLVFFRRRKKAV